MRATPIQVPQLKLPDDIFENADGKPGKITSGDKEMISQIMGIYAFIPDLRYQIRYTGVLLARAKSLLIKGGRYAPYAEAFKSMEGHWGAAVNRFETVADHDICMKMLLDLEIGLQAIIEKEGLAENSRSAYAGQILVGQIRGEETGEPVTDSSR
jgi:hypothetical protein